MICNICKNEFEIIDGLKYCPYCGTNIEETIESNGEQIKENYNNEEKKETVYDINNKNKYDTLPMPVITDKQINKYKKEKKFKLLKKSKVIITILTIFFLISIGGFGYIFLVGRPVDEGKIKEDIINKTITLPKGTKFDIKEGYIKSLSIKERNTKKKEKDDIKVEITLNNGIIEVNTLLLLQYVYTGNNVWKINDKVQLYGNTVVKPLVGMDENQILNEVKKTNILIFNISKSLSDNDVKKLEIISRKPDFNNFKEEVLVDTNIDSGIISSSGKIKVNLIFEDELWKIVSIEKNSDEDFKLVLSPSFSEDKIIEIIKKDTQNQMVTHPDIFGGKGFYINDTFTKSINIENKDFNPQNQNLNVTAKRQNLSGELKSVLSTDYVFKLYFNNIELLKKSKTTVDSINVNEISKDFVTSTIEGAEIEGNNLFFWYYNKHKITTEESKTFKTNKISSPKGLRNIKYVYGSIAYNDGKDLKTINLIAFYYLVYDNSKGYYWKLDRIIGEDSPNYKMYIS
ncbi:TFIIB-type zinc finger domain-containing protein [Clostridium prolinivorans]|jgi:uncharacterized Zn finger protein (UPF0148 family)|uniref:TFIIB-type zinc finger domain-containing protein n=1 Tax=Clostridium prolinivorans TaxID=2769420 RepID=UPI000FD84D2E|nr:TFIIB-type zinc finger domain-containing protein [Clostridium prolinivorans]